MEKTNKSCRGTKNGCYWPRGKMLGGTGAFNSMLYLRGNDYDYNHWKSLGNPGWGWTDVLPYFIKSETNKYFTSDYSNTTAFHSDKGEVNVELFLGSEPIKSVMMAAGKEKGYEFVSDMNAGTPLGYSFAQGMHQNGTRMSGAKAFLVTSKDRPNLHVIKHAHVTKVDINKNGEATGVQFVYNETTPLTARTKKEIIVSAGPIASPQLLLLSGIGSEKHLKKFDIPVVKNLPVGKNLQDHLVVPLFFQFHKSDAFQMTKTELLDSIYLYALHKMGPLAAHGGTDLIAFLNTVSHTGYPDIQLHHTTFRKSAFDLQFYLSVAGYEEMIGRHILDLNRMGDLMVVYVGLLKPQSRGTVKLGSADPKERPKLVSNYLNNERDVATLVRAIKFQADYVNTEQFEKHEGMLIRLPLPACKSMVYQSEEYWTCYIEYMSRSMDHQFGTTRMGPKSDKSAVVDERLRVHGVKRLRVVGSSVMPAAVSTNSNAVTFMIGEKASDFLKEDWQYVDKKKDEL